MINRVAVTIVKVANAFPFLLCFTAGVTAQSTEKSWLDRPITSWNGPAKCRPMDFNVFVFVGGQLAGTLSPLLMMSRGDGAIGAVRLAPDDTIAAEFARYADRDALCCPSGRVTVRYHIDRNGPLAVVVPVSMRATRP